MLEKKKKIDDSDNVTDAGDNDQSIFFLTVLENIKETSISFLKEV